MKVIQIIAKTRIGPKEHFLILSDRESSTPEEIRQQVRCWQDAFISDCSLEYDEVFDNAVIFTALMREKRRIEDKIENLNFKKDEINDYLQNF